MKLLILSALSILTAMIPVGIASAASISSDRIVIDASLVEDDLLETQPFIFSGVFPNNPLLQSASVYLTEPNDPMTASDLVSLEVIRLADPTTGNIIGMQNNLIFTSLDSPLPLGANTVPEKGGLQDLNSPEFTKFWGTALPFKASVQSDIESVPEPTSVLGILAFGTFGATTVLKRKLLLSNSFRRARNY